MSAQEPVKLLQPLQKFQRFPFHTLDKFETFWMEHQQWLEDKGYMLRPRFRRGWVPSWDVDDARVMPYSVEDSILLRVCFCLV